MGDVDAVDELDEWTVHFVHNVHVIHFEKTLWTFRFSRRTFSETGC